MIWRRNSNGMVDMSITCFKTNFSSFMLCSLITLNPSPLDQTYRRLFCRGVPDNNNLFSLLKFFKTLINLQFIFLRRWPSSTMMIFQPTYTHTQDTAHSTEDLMYNTHTEIEREGWDGVGWVVRVVRAVYVLKSCLICQHYFI